MPRKDVLYCICPSGEMAEWLNAIVLKTIVGAEPTGGSNPSLSATMVHLFPYPPPTIFAHFPPLVSAHLPLDLLWR